jgi:hypothetical protein
MRDGLVTDWAACDLQKLSSWGFKGEFLFSFLRTSRAGEAAR